MKVHKDKTTKTKLQWEKLGMKPKADAQGELLWANGYYKYCTHFYGPDEVEPMTKEDIAAACEKIGFKDYVFADTFEEAVEICKNTAQPGDCCLLSPACASWGMFKNYQQRGTMFKEYVNEIKE